MAGKGKCAYMAAEMPAGKAVQKEDGPAACGRGGVLRHKAFPRGSEFDNRKKRNVGCRKMELYGENIENIVFLQKTKRILL